MKVAVLRGPQDLVVIDIDEPVAGPDDIVVKVGTAGICGSDLASYATGVYVRPGQIMGHEFAGTVVEVGAHVVGIGEGFRVTVRPLGQCGACVACAMGLKHVCERAVRDAVGYGHPGAFAEYVRIPKAVLGDNVFALPDAMPDSSAAVVEVFAVALHAVSRLNASPGGSCVVLGLGPVGIAATQVLRSAGVHRIVGIDNSAFRQQMASSLGAQRVADFDGMLDAVRSVAGPGPGGRGAGADTVLEASGAAALLSSSTSLLRSAGRLGLVGLYKGPIALDMNEWVTRELELVGCYGYDKEFGDALELVTRNMVDVQTMITATYPLDSIVEAFAAQADPDHHVKVQIQP